LFEFGAVCKEEVEASGGWKMQVNIEPSSLERLCREHGQDLAMLQ
jgi:hypothetical protein